MRFRIRNRTSGLYLPGGYETADTAHDALSTMTADDPTFIPDHYEVVDCGTPPAKVTRNQTTYPFTLGEGRVAYLTLPMDLTQQEVDRISMMVSTLVMEEAAPR